MTSAAPLRLLTLVAMLASLAACSDDDSPTAPPVDGAARTLTVDASQQFAYVDLAEPATQVTVADPASSSAWDIGFFSTTVRLNGGASGPADVRGYCICQNAQATGEQIMAMTAESEAGDFEAVTAAQIPADDAFEEDVLAPAIAGWFTGEAGTSATADASRSWLVRLEGGPGGAPARYAKVHVTQLAGATASAPGQVTVEYAWQAAPGAEFGAPVTRTVDASAGPAYVSLRADAAGTQASHDLRIEGWTIRLNGDAAALLVSNTPFAGIDAAFAAEAPAQVFRADATSSVFNAQGKTWYRYNITGTDNQIWPSYDVYLVKRGDEVWKVQLTGYYDAAGKSRQVSMRYARLR